MSIGTLPSSITSKDVEVGGSVGNQIRKHSLHRDFCELAKPNTALLGSSENESPRGVAAFMKLFTLCLDPMARVHPRSKMQYVGC